MTVANLRACPISECEARALTDEIRTSLDAVWALIMRAYNTRAWEALGYAKWDDYCAEEFDTAHIRLPREERQEVVASMRKIGMPTRAIASATGTGYGTVARELAGDPNGSPEPNPITGMDGKTYQSRTQSDESSTPKPKPTLTELQKLYKATNPIMKAVMAYDAEQVAEIVTRRDDADALLDVFVSIKEWANQMASEMETKLSERKLRAV